MRKRERTRKNMKVKVSNKGECLRFMADKCYKKQKKQNQKNIFFCLFIYDLHVCEQYLLLKAYPFSGLQMKFYF